MANSRLPILGLDPFELAARTPGLLGHNDAASPDSPNWLIGDTPGPLGMNDHGDPDVLLRKLVIAHAIIATASTKTAPAAKAPVILRQGDRGEDVQKLQCQLNLRLQPSPRLSIDGAFGPVTHNVVLQYQKGVLLPQDAIVGKQTWYHLLKGSNAISRLEATPVPPLSVSSPGIAFATNAAPQAHYIGGPPPSPKVTDVWEWPLQEKFTEVLRRTAPKLPACMMREFQALLSPSGMAIITSSLVVWAGAHAFGVGEVADVVMLSSGVVFLGMAAFDVARELGDFLVITSAAASMQALEVAASHLARAISVMGVASFFALVGKVARGVGTKTEAVRASTGQALRIPPRYIPANEVRAPPRAEERISPHPTSESFLKPRLSKTALEPGAKPGPVSPTINAMPEIPKGFPKISQSEVNTFAKTPTPELLPAGTRLYRVVGEGNNASGSFWTRQLPATEAEWRSSAAVQGQWNGDGGYVEYTVPAGGMPAWTGKAASQPAALPGYVLNGGGDQVVFPPNNIMPSAIMPTPWNAN